MKCQNLFSEKKIYIYKKKCINISSALTFYPENEEISCARVYLITSELTSLLLRFCIVSLYQSRVLNCR